MQTLPAIPSAFAGSSLAGASGSTPSRAACDDHTMIEVRRRHDDELCGFIEECGSAWRALTVFGGCLSVHDRRDDAEREVLDAGLASLAERWTLIDATTGEEQVVCIQEASPTKVTLALDYYALPGVPSRTITRDELAEGRWRLQRR